MKKYYLYIDGKQLGPYTLEELSKNKNILSKETLAWHKDLINWMPLEQIEELEELCKQIPPTLSQKSKSKSSVYSEGMPPLPFRDGSTVFQQNIIQNNNSKPEKATKEVKHKPTKVKVTKPKVENTVENKTVISDNAKPEVPSILEQKTVNHTQPQKTKIWVIVLAILGACWVINILFKPEENQDIKWEHVPSPDSFQTIEKASPAEELIIPSTGAKIIDETNTENKANSRAERDKRKNPHKYITVSNINFKTDEHTSEISFALINTTTNAEYSVIRLNLIYNDTEGKTKETDFYCNVKLLPNSELKYSKKIPATITSIFRIEVIAAHAEIMR